MGLDLAAFGLLFVQLGLQFRGHLVVPILSLLKVDSHLVDVSERVEVLVLIHILHVLLALVLVVRVHGQDTLLQFLVFALQLVTLLEFFLDGDDEVISHFILTRQCRDARLVTLVITDLIRRAIANVLVAAILVLVLRAIHLGVALSRCLRSRFGVARHALGVVIGAQILLLEGLHPLLPFREPSHLLRLFNLSFLLFSLPLDLVLAHLPFFVCPVLDLYTRIGDQFERELESEFHTFSIDSFASRFTVLDLLDLLRTNEEFDVLHVVLVKQVLHRSWNMQNKLTTILVELDVARINSLDVFVHLRRGDNTCSIDSSGLPV